MDTSPHNDDWRVMLGELRGLMTHVTDGVSAVKRDMTEVKTHLATLNGRMGKVEQAKAYAEGQVAGRSEATAWRGRLVWIAATAAVTGGTTAVLNLVGII